MVRGAHFCFLRVTVPSGNVWSCFPPSVKSEESSLSDISFDWCTSLSPFPLLARFLGFVQFRVRPGLGEFALLLPDPLTTPRFMDGLTVPERLLVCALDSDEEQWGKSSLRSSFMSFPIMFDGAWHPTVDEEPRKRFNHSHSDTALQSHDQGLLLSRRYSREGSMSKHCPESCTRELLNR